MIKNLKYISIAVLLALFCNEVNAQKLDTITVTSTDTIYSGYNGSCFTGGCSYNLSVPIPPDFTITNIIIDFNYQAAGTCNLNQAGWDLRYRSCRNPPQGSFHTCSIGLPGLCIQQGIDIFADLMPCILPPQCAGYNMDFILTFYRCSSPGSGCSPSCFVGQPWTMSVIGYYNKVKIKISSQLNGDSVCKGSNVILTADNDSTYGISPITVAWNPGGQTGDSITVIPSSDTTFIATLTDSCGNVASDSIHLVATNCLGIESYSSGGFSIYPNPANTQLTLSSSFIHSKATNASILNLLGEEMPGYAFSFGEGRGEADVSKLPAGIYFVQLSAENRRWMARFVKE